MRDGPADPAFHEQTDEEFLASEAALKTSAPQQTDEEFLADEVAQRDVAHAQLASMVETAFQGPIKAKEPAAQKRLSLSTGVAPLRAPELPEQAPPAPPETGLAALDSISLSVAAPEGFYSPVNSVLRKLSGADVRLATGTMTPSEAVDYLAAKTGLDPAVVEAQLPKIRGMYLAVRFDGKSYERDFPKLAEWLRQSPEVAKSLPQDEVLHFGMKAARAIGAGVSGIVGGFGKLVNPALEDPFLKPLPGETEEQRQERIIAGYSGIEKRANEVAGAEQAKVLGAVEAATVPRKVTLSEDARAKEIQAMPGGPARWVAIMEEATLASRRGAEISGLYTEIANKALFGYDTTDLERELADKKALNVPRDMGLGEYEAILAASGDVIGSQIGTIKGAGGGALAVGAGAGLLALGTTKSPLAAAVAALGTGAKVGSSIVSFNQEFGSAFEQARNATTADGSRVDLETAYGFAMAYALGAVTIESASWGATGRALGPIGTALEKGGTGKLAAALLTLRNAKATKLFKSAAYGYLESGASNSAEEFSQAWWQGITGWGAVQAQEIENKGFANASPQPVPWEEINTGALEQGAAIAVGMLTGTPLMAAGSAIGNKALSATAQLWTGDGPAAMGGSEAEFRAALHAEAQGALAKIADAERGHEAVKIIGKLKDSPVATAHPEKTAQLLEAETANGTPITTLYVDPTAVLKLNQEGVDPETLLGPDAKARIEAALAAGGKIAVPLAEYLEKWVTSDAAEALADHTTTQAHHPTVYELQVEQAAEDGRSDSPAESKFYADMKAGLVAMGQHSPAAAGSVARYMTEKLKNAAVRAGKDADAVLTRYSFAFESAATRAAEAKKEALQVAKDTAEKGAAEAAAGAEERRAAREAALEAKREAKRAERWAKIEAGAKKRGETPQAAPGKAPAKAAPSVVPGTPEATGEAQAPATAAPAMAALDPSTKVYTPQRPHGEAAHYELMEADEGIPSHDPITFQKNPAHPGNERDIHRSAPEQAKIAVGATTLAPPMLLSNDPTAVNGPPLVTSGKRKITLGGNGRLMMLLRALAQNPERWAAYQQALAAALPGFGIDPARLATMRNPILVRVLDEVADTASPAELVAAVRRTNEGLTQALSATARAVAEAKNLSPDTFQAIAEILAAAGDDATLRQLMRDQGPAFIGVLRRDGIVTAQNQAAWIAGGNLTDEAKDRIEGMFLGKIVGSGDRMAATAPAVLAKLERLAPALLKVAGINPDADEIGTVQDAIDVLNDAARRSLTLAELTRQGDLFGASDYDPDVVRMAELLSEGKPTHLVARFRAWAGEAAVDPRQGSLFGAAAPEDLRAKLLADTITVREDGKLVILHQPAYHGGPHRFEKFSLQHIGTGEGAQVYGWGLYFTQTRSVAEQYRRQLSQVAVVLPVEPGTSAERAAASEFTAAMAHDGTAESLEGTKKAVRYRIARAEKELARRPELRAKAAAVEDAPGAVGVIDEGTAQIQAERDGYVERLAYLDRINPEDVRVDRGQVYQVDIPNSETLLDYDKPLSAQPEKVQAAIRSLFKPFVVRFGSPGRWTVRQFATRAESVAAAAEAEQARSESAHLADSSIERYERDADFFADLESKNGATIYKKLGEALGGSKEASEALRAAGIPGMRYLDGNSRDDRFRLFYKGRNISSDGGALDGLSDAEIRAANVLDAMRSRTGISDTATLIDRATTHGAPNGLEPTPEIVAALRSMAADFELRDVGSHNFVIWDDSQITTEQTFYQDAAPGEASEAALAQVFAERTAKGLEHRDYWTDYNTGAYNERAVEAMPHDPARPFLASADLEGAKAVNDNVSHAAQDLLLRAQVRAFHGLVPWVGKVGGGIQFSAEDAEDAQRITKLAQARLPNQRFRLLVAAVHRPEGAPFRDVMDAVSAKGKTAKDEARALGTFTARGDAPVHFLPKDEKGNPIPSDVTPGEEKVILSAEVKAALRKELKDFPAQEPLGAADFDVDPRLLERSRALGPVGVALGTYIDPKTGLYTLDGWERLEAALPQASAASIDLAYLRDLDRVFGRDPTDKLITWFGTLLGRELDFDFARLHGDEYAARHNDRTLLEKVIKSIRERGEKQTFFLRLPDGRLAVQQGLYFGQAVAETYLKADALVEPDKRETKDRAGEKGKPHVHEAGPDADALHAQLVAGGVAVDLSAPLREVPLGLRGRDLAGAVGGSEGSGLREVPEGPLDPRAEHASAGVAPPAGPTTYKQGEDDSGAPLSSGTRGRMERRGNDFKIVIEKNADMSTVLHELSHAYLSIAADLAAEAGTAVAFRQDFRTMIEWAGWATPEKMQADLDEASALSAKPKLTAAEKRYVSKLVAPHEKFARGFERYLREGKAPAARLQAPFSLFKKWLTGVYGDAAQLRVEFSPEVSSIFDRILASDEEIAAAENRMGLEPLFRSPEEFGGTAEEFAAYLKDKEKATSAAEQAAERALMRDLERTLTRDWKAKRKALQAEAAPEYDVLPVRQAQLALQGKGVGADGKPFSLGVKLPPAVVAERFGYADVGALHAAIAALQPRDTWSLERADQRMEELYPDLLNNRAVLRRMAEDGLHSEQTAEWLLKEWAALDSRAQGPRKASKNGQPARPAQSPTQGQLNREATRKAAEEAVERILLKDLGKRVASAVKAEKSAANKAATEAAKKNYPKAAVHKLQQILNGFVYTAARAAQDEAKKTVKLLRTLKKEDARNRLGLANQDLLQAVDEILFALQGQPVQGRSSLEAAALFVESTQTPVAWEGPALEDFLRAPKPLEGLTVAEHRQVRAALLSMQRAGLVATTAIREGKREEKADAIYALTNEAQAVGPDVIALPSSDPAQAFWAKVARTMRSIDGSLRKPAEMMLRLGGKNLAGAWYQYVVKPLQEAKYKEADLLKKILEPIVAAFNAMPENVRRTFNDDIDGTALFPNHKVRSGQALPAPTKKFELIALALNIGNESNIKRMTEGRNITLDEVTRAIEKHLDAETMLWIVSVWKAGEQLWPEIEAVQKRTVGTAPPKLVLRPISLTFGGKQLDLEGGYYPAIYDANVETVGRKQESADFFDPSYVMPGTSHSFTKKRVPEFYGALSLDPGHLPTHLAKVIHDLAFREPLQSVVGLLLSPKIQTTMIERLGKESSDQMLTWLKDIGGMRSMDGAAHTKQLDKIIKGLKSNTIVGVLGYSLQTALADYSQLAAAVAGSDLRAEFWAEGLATYASGMLKWDAFAHEHSGELRYRRDSLQREFLGQIDRITDRSIFRNVPLLRGFKAHAFVFMEFSDRTTTVPVWLGSYRQALADGLDETAAQTFANAQIHHLFPGHSAVDKAAISRSKAWWGQALYFYGFFSTAYNVAAAHVDTIVDPHGSGLSKAKATGLLAAYLLTVGPLAELLSGRGPPPPPPEEEDAEEKAARWAQWLLMKTAMFGLSTLPTGGDAAYWAETKLLGQQSSAKNMGPTVMGGELALGIYGILAPLFAEEEIDPADAGKRAAALIRAAMPFTGIPTAAPMRAAMSVGKAIERTQAGEPPYADPVDAAGKLIHGEKRNPQQSIPSMISDLIQE